MEIAGVSSLLWFASLASLTLTIFNALGMVALLYNYTRLRQDNEDLRDELRRKNKLIDAWRIGIEKLIRQVLDLKQDPVWTPDDETA